MTTSRNIRSIQKSIPTLEGAGVHLRRAFGNNADNAFDPFLLLDDFRSDVPSHYLKGFPWHPHRGIETITYVTKGDVEHGDSMGNKGIISSGDVQWMTAGSGIIHQEMPKGDKNGVMDGFQLWANLPASHKMILPRYRDVKSSQIPEVTRENGVKIRIICGTVEKTSGPVKDIVTEPEYLDVIVPPNAGFVHSVKRSHTVFAYVFEGSGFFDPRQESSADNGSIILFDDGDQVTVSTGKNPVRFLLVSGKPLGEPVAWYGPIVMNTEEELRIAFEEYENGTFIKHDTKKGKRKRTG
jgi:redox-sensitive bicupin YhaK (pirin superfamily)